MALLCNTLLALAALLPGSTSPGGEQTGAQEQRIWWVGAEFSSPGVVSRPGELHLASSAHQEIVVPLDPEIEVVVQVATYADKALVVGSAKYGWVLQQVRLSDGHPSRAIRCGQPRPQVSPKGDRVAFVTANRGRRDLPSNDAVVEVLDLAFDQAVRVFPEEALATDHGGGIEFDDYWHTVIWGNLLWNEDGSSLVLVAARGLQWWNLDLCLVEMGSGLEKVSISRRKLDFSGVLREGYSPSTACKFAVQSLSWTESRSVSVGFDGCLFVSQNTLTVAIPTRARAKPLNPALFSRKRVELEKALPGPFALLSRVPWYFSTRVGSDGTVDMGRGEKLSFYSDPQGVRLDVRLAALESEVAAAEAASLVRSGNPAAAWVPIPAGSVSSCASGGCWSSEARGLYRVLASFGNQLFLVTAYGSEILPGEPAGGGGYSKQEAALTALDLLEEEEVPGT